MLVQEVEDRSIALQPVLFLPESVPCGDRVLLGSVPAPLSRANGLGRPLLLLLESATQHGKHCSILLPVSHHFRFDNRGKLQDSEIEIAHPQHPRPLDQIDPYPSGADTLHGIKRPESRLQEIDLVACEAVEDCDSALALDPSNQFFRSCGITNSLAGRPDRALQFLELSEGTEYSFDNKAMVLLRQGKVEEAVGMFRGTDPSSQAVIDVLEAGPALEPERLQQIVDSVLATSDAELPYWSGAAIARAGWDEAVAAGKAYHERFLE